jgi:hypothetical protein
VSSPLLFRDYLRAVQYLISTTAMELYTWCALDTLIFPVVLDWSAVIESTSPTSGSTIRVIATPTAVTAVEPATAVVSLVNPEDLTSIRSSFCNQLPALPIKRRGRHPWAPWLGPYRAHFTRR